MSTDLSVLNKTSRLLNECIRRSENDFKVDYNFLCSELDLDILCFRVAVLKGYFTDLGEGKIKANIAKAELTHCREIFIQLELHKLVINTSNKIRSCVVCGNQYTYKSKKATYCSNACRLQSFRDRSKN